MTDATKFRRQFDKSYKGSPSPVPDNPTVTVPSMTLTVKELMERHTRGLTTGTLTREEMFLPEGMEVKRPTDLTDLIEYREELEAKTKELNETIKREKAAAKDAEQRASEGQTPRDNTNGSSDPKSPTPPQSDNPKSQES